MSSKEKVLKDLLVELDTLCRQHDIKYSLAGQHVEYIIEHGELPAGFTDITVAMTIGDVEKLMKLVNESENRRVECFANNYNARDFGIRYYNMNTSYINIFDYRNHTYQGIFLRILEIEKSPKKLARKKFALLKKVCKGTNINNYSIRNLKNIILSLAIKFIKLIVGDKKFHEKAYELKKQYVGIDSWRSVDALKNARDFYIDGNAVMVAEEMANVKVQKDRTLQYVEKYEIIDVEKGYKDIMDKDTVKSLNVISHNIDKYYAMQWGNEEHKKAVATAWNTYLMSRDVVLYRRIYSAEKIVEINKLIESAQYAAAIKELDTYYKMRKTWEKKKIKFLRSNELETLVEKIADMA